MPRRACCWAFLCAVTVTLLIVADLAVGLVYPLVTPESGRLAIAHVLGETDLTNQFRLAPHPSLLYQNSPRFESDGVVQHNTLGYRNAEFDSTKNDRTRILALGGSTTYGAGVPSPSQAWPMQLDEALNSRPDIRADFQVINAGLNSANSAELLAHYVFRHRYLKSDVVILHIGGNDVSPLMTDGYNPEYSHYRMGIGPSPLVARRGERLLCRSNIAKVAYSWWFKDMKLHDCYPTRQPFTEFGGDVTLANVHNNEPVGFRRNLEVLIRNIIADGAKPVLFAFQTRPGGEGHWPEVAIFREHRAAFYEGLEKNFRVLEEISEQFGVPLLRLDDDTIPAERFLDDCHLDAAGHRLKAEFLARELPALIGK